MQAGTANADSLGVSSDSVTPGPVGRTRRGDVVPYDFRRPSKLSREHIRSLQMAYDVFARRMTTMLTSGLRQVCQVTLSEITQVSYEEYITGLSPQTLLTPLRVPPLAGSGVLEFSLPVALASIDHMLGGPGGEQSPRPLTDIETGLMRGLLEQMCGVLRYSFESIVTVTPTVGPIEYNPQFIQAAGATDAMVVGEFNMIVGRERCPMTLCLPLAGLLPHLAAHRAPVDAEITAIGSDALVRRVHDRAGDLPMNVTVAFSDVHLSPDRILSMVEGDLIVLNHRIGQPLAVKAGGVTFAHAIAGKSGNRLAALVVSNPQEETQ